MSQLSLILSSKDDNCYFASVSTSHLRQHMGKLSSHSFKTDVPVPQGWVDAAVPSAVESETKPPFWCALLLASGSAESQIAQTRVRWSRARKTLTHSKSERSLIIERS